MSQLSIVGKSVPRLDALEKVTGKAMYCADFKLPGMLYARVLRSPYAHARIVRIDTAKAEKLPGVRAVVSGKDAPDVPVGAAIHDQYLLAKDGVVRCIGQAVAAVAAESIGIAEEALELIDVEYEELPAVFDVEEAARKNPPAVIHPGLSQYFSPDPLFKKRIHPQEMPNVCYHFRICKGDVEKAFARADFVLENRYSTPRVSHAPLETHRADVWLDPDGTLVMRSSTSGVWPGQQRLATLFNLPPSKVRILSSYVGGSFGGKGTNTLTEPIAALLAIKSGRPVRLAFTREEHFVDGRHRSGFVVYVKDGVNKDGTLVAREMRVFLDIGRHTDSAAVVIRNSAFGSVGTYSMPNFKIDNYGVYTNNPLTSPYRGLGTPEITWAVEQQMDILARKIGMDPAEFRRRNILKEGEKDVCGQLTRSTGAGECLDKVTGWLGWGKDSRSEYPWKVAKGIALGNKYTMTGTSSSAIVKVHRDGTIEVRHGNQDVGQGLNTVLAQIAAEEFGTTVERVKMVWGDTSFVPYDFQAISSRSTFHTGNAVKRACQDAKRKLFEVAASKLGVSPATLEVRNGVIHVIGWPGKTMPLSDLFTPEGIALQGGEYLGSDYFQCPFVLEDVETGQSERIVAYYAHCAHGVEVAVNVETGEVKLLQVVGAFDSGTIVNPRMAEAQIEGGLAQALGSALSEQIVLDKGVVVNPTFMDYKMLGSTELPGNRNVKAILVEVPHPEGPFGAKGLGEGTLVPLAPAIANAIYNATGIRFYELPLTRQKVLMAIKEVEKEKLLVRA